MRETLGTRLDAAPVTVFERVTDVERLPEWNHAITEVLEQPARLVPGSVWKVRLHALGQSWVSKSTLVELDEATGAFRYRSQSDDGNPSYAEWEWRVEPDGTGSHVTVTVDLHPVTFWRKHLLVKLRRPALRHEMRASLAAHQRPRSRSPRAKRVAEHVESARLLLAGGANKGVDRWPDLHVGEPCVFEHLLPARTGQPTGDSAGP